jgi:hypothetical protein
MFCLRYYVRFDRYVNGQLAGSLGEVLIRCNNVLYIRAAPEADESSIGATNGGFGGADNGVAMET